MKISPLLLLCLGLPLLAAAQQPPVPTPVAPLPAPGKPAWSVRLEMLMVELPQDKALALLPDLNDPAKIDGACDRLLEAVGRKEATLVGCPVAQSLSGGRTTTETIDELVYPTQFQPPQLPQSITLTSSDAALYALNVASCPTNFEKRNVGVVVEYEAVVKPGGQWIDLNIQPQHVVFQGYEWYETSKTTALSASLPQPRFFTTKTSTEILVRSGQRVLLGVHKLKGNPERIELDVVRAVATPADD